METKINNKAQTGLKDNYLVLVPHRDTRIELKKHSNNLIKEGLTEVYPFPLVAPLASLKKPLESDELKKIAGSLRKAMGENIFKSSETTTINFPQDTANMTLFGPRLDLDTSSNKWEISSDKIINLIKPLLIGTFLIPIGVSASEKLDKSSYSSFSFRAAAVANMYWQPCMINGEISYKWKIGKLFWLPSKK